MGNGQTAGLARGIRTLWSSGAIAGLGDAELLERFARSRDEDAFEALVERHGSMVLRVVRDVLRDPHSAEDAFQATFLVLARKAGSIARPEALTAWLHGVAHRVARKARVEAGRRQRHEQIAAERRALLESRPETGPDVGPSLHDELARLPESSRVAVLLCYFEGLTYDQAAWRLGVTEATIRGRLARARNQLRTGLAARGTTAWSLPAVPFPWINPTVRAASRFARGWPGATKPSAVGLAEGVLRTMMISPLKVAAVLVAFQVVAIAGVLAQGPAAEPKSTSPTDATETKPKAEPEADRLTLTLDQAIERMLRNDGDLLGRFAEIPQARVNILTVGFRENPPLYYDFSGLVRYGRFLFEGPADRARYDVNVSRLIELARLNEEIDLIEPIVAKIDPIVAKVDAPPEIWRKRQVRAASKVRAVQVTEAHYQDAVRHKVAGVSKAFLEAVAACELADERSKTSDRLTRLLVQAQEKGKSLADRERIEAARDEARRESDQAEKASRQKLRDLGRVLQLDDADSERLEVVGELDRLSDVPPLDFMTALALEGRSDVVAYRLGVERARADVKLQSSEPIPDLYLLTQHYLAQAKMPFDARKPTSTSVGVTVPTPIDNRNQGNIQRARMNVTQTEVELTSIEKGVKSEVEEAHREVLKTSESAQKWLSSFFGSVYSRKIKESAYLNGKVGVDAVLARYVYEREMAELRVEKMRAHRLARVELNQAIGRRVIEP